MVGRVSAEGDRSAGIAAETAVAVDHLRQRLAALVDEDAAAYRSVVKAGRLPPEGRAAALEAALRRATEVPLEVARRAREVLARCEALVPAARASALADLGVAALLACGAIEAAALTARANLRRMGDAAFGQSAEEVLRETTREGVGLRDRILAAIARRS